MPQVNWQKQRRRWYPRWVWFVVMVAVVSIVAQILPLMKPSVALAAPSLPDNTLNSNNMTLVISQSNEAGVINAPDDYVKIYLGANDTGSPRVDLWNPDFNPCNGATKTASDWDDPANPCTTSFEHVHYDFYAMDANETNPVTSPTPGSPGPLTYLFTLDGGGGAVTGPAPHPANIASPHNGWSGGIPLPVSWTQVSSLTGYRVILMQAHYASATLPAGDISRVHSYQIRTENTVNDDLGYWEAPAGSPPPDGEYIIHYLGSQTNFMVANTEFRFAPPCTLTSDQPAKLRWFDADWQPDFALGPWYRHPFFYFYQIDQNGNQLAPIIIDGSSSPTLGGNNEYREYNFTAHPGWKYRWVWHNMNGPFGGPPPSPANNIQMWLPFDSINYNLTCWDYHSTIGSADGRLPNANLDFSNPADQTVKFWVNARNVGTRPGPVAHTTPTISPGGWASLVTVDGSDPQVNNGDINTSINGLSSDTSYFGHGAKFEYKFDPLTPTGNYCFGDTIAPQTASIPIAPSDNTVCYHVQNDRRYPSLQGLNSDIHAGGGLCPDQNAGNVQGGNNITGGGANSYGQYVVSAASVGGVGGMINDFGSNNSRGSTQLNIGKNGPYQQICRKDLYTYAEQSKNLADANQHQLGPGTYRIDPAWSGIYYANGPISLSSNPGGVNHRVTIVMESGDLSITGDITLNTSFGAPRADPATGAEGPASLGIITNGPGQSVFIEPAVRNLEAYVFSDGTIDTCATSTVFAPPGCDSTLTINGFLMAKDINFKRTGPAGTLGAQIGEQVRLTPELYLNPPYFFDSGVDSTQLEGLGEKQPLF